MGLTQDELAQHARMKLSALKTLENGYAKFTTLSNIDTLARVLRVSIQDLVLEGLEWFPANFFVLKNPGHESLPKRRRDINNVWFRRQIVKGDGFLCDFVSPPLCSYGHFCFVILELDPGKTIRDAVLPSPDQLLGFVLKGALRIRYDNSQEYDVFANQSFTMRGDKIHDLQNADKNLPLRMCLAFTLSSSQKPLETAKEHSQDTPCFNLGLGIKKIRDLYASSDERSLSYSHFSSITGLDEQSLRYLENTTDPDQVIYWDKIEVICRALKIPLSQFLGFCEDRDGGYFYLSTAHDRAFIDYRHYLGVRIKSAVFPGTHNNFHLSEAYIDPRGGVRRASWRRRDQAMMAAYVEDGELRIEVGKNRKSVLIQGESVYFDGSLGYIFTNPGTKPAKLLLASYPAIVF